MHRRYMIAFWLLGFPGIGLWLWESLGWKTSRHWTEETQILTGIGIVTFGLASIIYLIFIPKD